ncbi:kinase modulator [Lithospermum erythrorhizon]|uniref:Kinase modulator n=1 Tax=Lithospermum erythrorhizon TaxID=34254 RepID=A0AAV3PYH2_LITER
MGNVNERKKMDLADRTGGHSENTVTLLNWYGTKPIRACSDAPEDDYPPEQGIPTLITWSRGGNNVLVEGSWDNWKLRKAMHRSGKDHSVLQVLASGIYHYKFIVDGEVKYIAELPHEIDDMGHVSNLLDVNDYIPENPKNVAEFEAPPSPDSIYGQTFPGDDDFAKEPVIVPPQFHLTVLEKGWASQSMVALGLTHRFHSKYVTVVLYKPLKR